MRFHIVAVLALLASGPALAQDITTAEMAHQEKFAKAWHSMTELPSWIHGPDATSVPVQKVTISGRQYLAGHICQPHNCSAEQMEVLFSLDGKKAWGLWSSQREQKLWQMPLGAPDDTQLNALIAAWHSSNPG